MQDGGRGGSKSAVGQASALPRPCKPPNPRPGWWRLAVGGSWRLAVGGPLGRSLRAVLNKNKKKSGPLRTTLGSGSRKACHPTAI